MPLLTHYLYNPKNGSDYSILLFAVNGDFLWHWARTPFRPLLLAQAWVWVQFADKLLDVVPTRNDKEADPELVKVNRVADFRLYSQRLGDEYEIGMWVKPIPPIPRLHEVQSWIDWVTGKPYEYVGAAYHVKGKGLAEDFSHFLDDIGVPWAYPRKQPYFGLVDGKFYRDDFRAAGLGRICNIGSAREYRVLRDMQLAKGFHKQIEKAQADPNLPKDRMQLLRGLAKSHNESVRYLQANPKVQP